MRRLLKSVSIRASLMIAAVLPMSSIDTVQADEDAMTATFANYARYGADVWARHPGARIAGEGKSCISCHTSLPYALVEPLIGGDYPAYADMIANIDHRITGWSDNTPWYADAKLEDMAEQEGAPPEALKDFLDAKQSRGVEAVFNALIRAVHDRYAGAPASRETRRAFENMWAEQIVTGPASGRWRWIQANLVPWEVNDSDRWGASLACVAASIYPDLADEAGTRLLHEALSRAFVDESVSLHTRSAILWCNAELGGQLLDRGESSALASRLLALQRDDGGWALRDIGPWPDWDGSDNDCCEKREVRSDAYATGLIVLALARHGAPSTDFEEPMQKAVQWIDRELSNRYPDGPRYNRHSSSESALPEFRNNLYTNAGHMWSFLGKTAVEKQGPLWE